MCCQVSNAVSGEILIHHHIPLHHHRLDTNVVIDSGHDVLTAHSYQHTHTDTPLTASRQNITADRHQSQCPGRPASICGICRAEVKHLPPLISILQIRQDFPVVRSAGNHLRYLPG